MLEISEAASIKSGAALGPSSSFGSCGPWPFASRRKFGTFQQKFGAEALGFEG